MKGGLADGDGEGGGRSRSVGLLCEVGGRLYATECCKGTTLGPGAAAGM